MNGLGERHRGDLDGKLALGKPTTVAVSLPEQASVADQHTAWLLIDLLIRLEGVVDRIVVSCPRSPIAARVSPHAAAGTLFTEAVFERSSQIGGVPVMAASGRTGETDLVLHVGPGGAVRDGWRVSGHGWVGTLSQRAVIAPTEQSALPFGPYVAACLGAGEIFRKVMLPAECYGPVETVEIDLWRGLGDERGPDAPLEVTSASVDFGLAGVGAVGVAVLHTLWACDGLAGGAVIADNDAEGVDETNLNRCVLFDRRHVGAPKASTACEIYGPGQLVIKAVDGPYDSESLGDRSPSVLLSAVDANASRHALQRAIVPGIAFGASTEELRAELVVFGPPGEGPCLACHNPVLAGVPDDLHRAEVRAMSPEERASLAGDIDASVEELQAWAQTGDCGTISAQALGHLLAEGTQPPMWSVGFVSVHAGVMLAARLVKHSLAHEQPPEATSTKFQFHRPQAAGNGTARAQLRDRDCPVCSNEIHRMVWAAHRG